MTSNFDKAILEASDSLRQWFKRGGGSYPACRPTKAQCRSIKGKMYKKTSSKRVNWKKKK